MLKRAGVSNVAFAEIHGVTEGAVRAARRDGRLQPLPDGSLDPSLPWPGDLARVRRPPAPPSRQRDRTIRPAAVPRVPGLTPERWVELLKCRSIGQAIREGRGPSQFPDGSIDVTAVWHRSEGWPFDDPPPLQSVPLAGALAAERALLCDVGSELVSRLGARCVTLWMQPDEQAVRAWIEREVWAAIDEIRVSTGLALEG